MLEWLKFWEWETNTCDRVVAMSNLVTMIGAFAGLIYWIRTLRNLIKNLFMFFIVKPIKKLLYQIREKIIGKENLELLKELKILKGNKRAIEILGYLSSEDESSKVNGYYEALLSFMCLYSQEMNFNEFKEIYKKDEEDRIQYGAGINIYKLREKVLKELIKKYSK